MDRRALAALPLAIGLLGCSGRSTLEPGEAARARDGGAPEITTAGKVDLLLVVDNSRNAGVVSGLLADTIADREGRVVESPLFASGRSPDGHERLVPDRSDLQFACIFEEPEPMECAGGACECSDAITETNPLCQAADGTYGPVQRAAGAVPSLRPLEVLHGLGEQAVVASVCADVVHGAARPTFGYNPAVDALLRSLRKHLR